MQKTTHLSSVLEFLSVRGLKMHGKAPGLASETLTLTVKGGITGPGPQPIGSGRDGMFD